MIFKPRKSQTIVNLTHGTPIKDATGKLGDQRYVNKIISTSKFSMDLSSKAHQTEHEKFIITGFPRNDILNTPSDKYENTIVWLPTYRTHKSELATTQSDSFPLNLNEYQFKEIDDILKLKDFKLLIKPHPAQKLDIIKNKFSNICTISDADIINQNTTLYSILKTSAALITDYSSVYLDYLLLNRPIIFTFDDLDNYLANWGFMVDDILKYTPGPHVYSYEEFKIEILKIINQDNDIYMREREKQNLLFNKFADDKSTERLLKEIGII